jgi:hypothetical protein
MYFVNKIKVHLHIKSNELKQNDMKTQLENYGKSLIGKSCQSSLVTELSNKGKKIMQKPSKIVGYEINLYLNEPQLMLVLDTPMDGEVVVYEDTCININ